MIQGVFGGDDSRQAFTVREVDRCGVRPPTTQNIVGQPLNARAFAIVQSGMAVDPESLT